MKKIFLSEPFYAINSLANVVTHSQPMENKANFNTNVNNNQILSKISENEVVNQIASDLLNTKKSATKITSEIDFEQFKSLYSQILDVAEIQNTKLSEEQKKSILDKISLKEFKKFKQEIKKTLVSFRKQEKNKALSEEFKSSLKELVTDKEKNYKVNIIEGEENSKQALFTLEKLDKLLKESKEVKDVLVKELKDTEILLSLLLRNSLVLSVNSIIYSIMSLTNPGFGFLLFTNTFVSVGYWIWYKNVSDKRDKLLNRIKNYDKIFGHNSSSGLYNAFEAFKNIISAGHSVRAWAQTPAISKITNIISVATSAVLESINIYFTQKELEESNARIDKINLFEKELQNLVSNWEKEYKDIQNFNWVVINETKQTDYYYNGGTGGKNLVFKNLKTNEIKTISEMLSLDEITLYNMGLMKVYNSKLEEWYIKKLPNKTKKDNLG
ncbi:hypothetical protein [Mesomycoplasma molare]|uniref:Uncharacterized protein n=1 Tax=Mesomycoplasma molare TaxID=171288 RepID=A0ABY5TW53_9BACT|nr:hypothetical protein [Mesomycoplasma molare]UWD34231.1 hypothetical protein NX772_00145 [Mesomycoplasma molare]